MDDRFLGTTAVCFVFNFCLLCSQTLPVSERNLPVPRPSLNKFLKYVVEDRIKIYRKKSCRLKIWMEFVRQISMKLKTSSNEGLLMKVVSHSLMWLSKHCSASVHTNLMWLCASAVMWLTGGLYAMLTKKSMLNILHMLEKSVATGFFHWTLSSSTTMMFSVM